MFMNQVFGQSDDSFINKKTIFCLPHAGGSATIYEKWKRHCNEKLVIVPLEIAGRGTRSNEKFHMSLDEVADDLSEQILSIASDIPYIIFGHSMGGMLTYLVTKKLLSMKAKLPQKIFISACNPPHVRKAIRISHLPDDDFVRRLIDYGGMPEAIVDNLQMLHYYLPILRNDFQMIECYIESENQAVIPISAVLFYGSEDIDTNKRNVSQWSKYFFNTKVEKINGNHFYHTNNFEEVLKKIEDNL